MSFRLTNDLREAIASQAVAHAFDPRKAALTKAEGALAEEAYNHVFPESERKLITKIPSNWVRFDSCLRFNVAGLTNLCAYVSAFTSGSFVVTVTSGPAANGLVSQVVTKTQIDT